MKPGKEGGGLLNIIYEYNMFFFSVETLNSYKCTEIELNHKNPRGRSLLNNLQCGGDTVKSSTWRVQKIGFLLKSYGVLILIAN